MPNASRASVRAALIPNQWVCLFRKQDPYADPAFFYHHVNMHLEAEPVNGAGARVKIQHSEDGVTWVDLYTHPTLLVPGGHLDLSQYHVRKWVRVLLYSAAGGVIQGTIVVPEAQVLPQLEEDLSLTCASFCEQDCETGTETVG